MTALRQVPVRISGEYRPVAYVGHIDWHGVASADEPITALVLARNPSGTRWARVGHDGARELSILLRVRPAESDLRNDIVVALTINPAVGEPFGNGSAGVATPVRLTSAAPFMFLLNHHETGVVSWFARAWSDEDERFGALFVAEADTKSARNGLWHMRPGIEGPDASITQALMRGRNGALAN